MSINANMGSTQKIKTGMTNSAVPDETARDEPSHLDLHCLRRCLFLVCMAEMVKYDTPQRQRSHLTFSTLQTKWANDS